MRRMSRSSMPSHCHEVRDTTARHWLRLLRLFLRLRGRRALDGVVWNIPLARLQDGEQAANLGLAARRRYVELTQPQRRARPVLAPNSWPRLAR